MPETIPGGAYQTPDGAWVDANGKPISERAVRQFLALQSQPPAEQMPRPVTPPIAPAPAPAPPVSTVTAAVPPALPPEEPPQSVGKLDETPKRGRGKGKA